jgi:hypothetical protein
LEDLLVALRQIKKWKDNNEHVTDHGATVILAASATSSIMFMYSFARLYAFVAIGIIPGVMVLVFLPVGLWSIIGRIRKLKDADENKINGVPLYFVSIPLIAFLTLFFLVRPASDFSRDFAIKRSHKIIASLEQYKITNRQYPETLSDLYPDHGKKMPKPSIMGIPEVSLQQDWPKL